MTKFMLIGAAAAAALSTQVSAQQPAPAQGHANHGAHRAHADQTRQQALQRADAMFQRLDANRDGVLTREEAAQAAAAKQAKRQGQRQRSGHKLDKLFGQSASITQAQFQTQALARFDRLDLNRDGTVTAAERQQARAARAQQRAQ